MLSAGAIVRGNMLEHSAPSFMDSHARRIAIVALPCFIFLFPSFAANASSYEPVGKRYELKLADLPAPYSAAPPHIKTVDVERPQGTMPVAPEGFTVSIFASGLSRPREIAVAADGDVFVSQTFQGNVVGLRDADGDGVAETKSVVADGFREPSGLAIAGNALYVADRRAVWRLPLGGEPLRAGPREMVTRPGALGVGGGHITREIAFAPDGKSFFVSIGSVNNIGEEARPRATIQQFSADGSLQETYASGLRNPVGLAFRPDTDDLYAVVNEREGLGDGLVPDFLTKIEKGGFYGYPYAYLGPHPDPQFGDLRPDLVKATRAPDVLLAPQSGPLGLLFYQGENFPPEYKGDALVALHGAWAGGRPAGYEIVRVPFREGRPEGGYQSFLTGFGEAPDSKAEGQSDAAVRVWGRPVWLAESPDGSLLVSDDVANVIWRVRWSGPVAEAESPAAHLASDLLREIGQVFSSNDAGDGSPATGFMPSDAAR